MDSKKFIEVDVDKKDFLLKDKLVTSGVHQWHLAFDADFKLWCDVRHTVNDFDIVYLSMTPYAAKACFASAVRKAITNENTKFVISVDHSVVLWQIGFQSPGLLAQELEQADMVFSPEHAMLSFIRTLIGEKVPTHVIPHPTDTEGLAAFKIPPDVHENDIAAVVHAWDSNWWTSAATLRDIGYLTWMICHRQDIIENARPFYDKVFGRADFPQYVKWVARRGVVLDGYHWVPSYGRMAAENAVLGVPTVGSSCVESQAYLWPDLTVTPCDTYQQRKLILKLLSDKSFYHDCVDKAAELSVRYSRESCKRELLERLYNG